LGLISPFRKAFGFLFGETCKFEEIIDDEPCDQTLGCPDFGEFVEFVNHLSLREIGVEVKQTLKCLHANLGSFLLAVFGLLEQESFLKGAEVL